MRLIRFAKQVQNVSEQLCIPKKTVKSVISHYLRYVSQHALVSTIEVPYIGKFKRIKKIHGHMVQEMPSTKGGYKYIYNPYSYDTVFKPMTTNMQVFQHQVDFMNAYRPLYIRFDNYKQVEAFEEKLGKKLSVRSKMPTRRAYWQAHNEKIKADNPEHNQYVYSHLAYVPPKREEMLNGNITKRFLQDIQRNFNLPKLTDEKIEELMRIKNASKETRLNRIRQMEAMHGHFSKYNQKK